MSGSCTDAGPEPATGPGDYVVSLYSASVRHYQCRVNSGASAFLPFAHTLLYQAPPRIHIELVKRSLHVLCFRVSRRFCITGEQDSLPRERSPPQKQRCPDSCSLLSARKKWHRQRPRRRASQRRLPLRSSRHKRRTRLRRSRRRLRLLRLFHMVMSCPVGSTQHFQAPSSNHLPLHSHRCRLGGFYKLVVAQKARAR